MKGGHYSPLSASGMQRIHEAALDILEEIGLANAPPSGVKAMTAAGARQGADGRLRFSRALVEDILAKAARSITLYGRDPKFDLHLEENCVHYGTAGAAVHVVDPFTKEYRDPLTADLYDAARLVQNLDNIHFFQRPMVCRDIDDNLELDLNTIYACVAGTKKHIGTSFSHPDNVDPATKMIHMLADGEAEWRARPFISTTNCFVVPPMKFADVSFLVMERCIHAGMPVLLLSAGQAGATAPAPIAAAIVQAVAECLAGVVYVNSVVEGHPAVFGTWPFVSDLRTGAMSGGSAEQALLTAGCAQMHRFYGLPGGAAGGMADSKLPDIQTGWEQGICNVMAGLAGLNMVYESVGMQASLLGFCFESLVLGDDIIGQALRCVRGIEVNEDTVSIETMRQVCLGGPGHYLGSDQTLSMMQTEYTYPVLGNRMSPKEWDEAQKPEILTEARVRVDRLLSEARIQVTDDMDRKIRAEFRIHF